jgi:hypothetical protein
MISLAREVQACEVRLGLLGQGNGRRTEMRDELEARLNVIKRRLEKLEADHGWTDTGLDADA